MDAVFKVRKRLPYRLRELDDSIRRQRTVHEAEMIASARRAGVRSPHIYCVDLVSHTLVMEYIAGPRLKDIIPGLSSSRTRSLFILLGSEVAKLHSSGIMHGDLTTANIVSQDGSMVFLDFGLSIRSGRVEDHAVDLRLIKETLSGAHPGIAKSAMAGLSEGYRDRLGEPRARTVLKQLSSIERRGRYARVT